MTAIDELKIILRENDIPFFSDAELQYYLDKNQGNVDNTAYQTLLIKAENTTLSISVKGMRQTLSPIWISCVAGGWGTFSFVAIFE